VWQIDEHLPDVASPLSNGPYVFFATSYGTLACLEAGSGRTVWTEEFDEGFYASPILVGKRVYALDTGGTMRIFPAGDRYDPLAHPELGEQAFATPAFVEGGIYIRGAEHVYCITGGAPPDNEGVND
jgi:outer membrane protein assembly factor BamB